MVWRLASIWEAREARRGRDVLVVYSDSGVGVAIAITDRWYGGHLETIAEDQWAADSKQIMCSTSNSDSVQLDEREHHKQSMLRESGTRDGQDDDAVSRSLPLATIFVRATKFTTRVIGRFEASVRVFHTAFNSHAAFSLLAGVRVTLICFLSLSALSLALVLLCPSTSTPQPLTHRILPCLFHSLVPRTANCAFTLTVFDRIGLHTHHILSLASISCRETHRWLHPLAGVVLASSLRGVCTVLPSLSFHNKSLKMFHRTRQPLLGALSQHRQPRALSTTRQTLSCCCCCCCWHSRHLIPAYSLLLSARRLSRDVAPIFWHSSVHNRLRSFARSHPCTSNASHSTLAKLPSRLIIPIRAAKL